MGKKIRRFPSGAVRSSNEGRERPDFISPFALKAIGEYFAGFAGDFGQTNYFLGIPEDVVLESLNRHLLDLHIAILQDDKEAARTEWQAICTNGIMGLHTVEIKRLGMYKEVYDKTELIDSDLLKNKSETLFEKKQRLQRELDEVSRQLREEINKSK
jgi:hypothetical protein